MVRTLTSAVGADKRIPSVVSFPGELTTPVGVPVASPMSEIEIDPPAGIVPVDTGVSRAATLVEDISAVARGGEGCIVLVAKPLLTLAAGRGGNP